MLFSKPLTILAGLLSLGTSVHAASKDTLLTTLQDGSGVTSQANDIARSISITNVFNTASQLINKHRELISTLNNGLSGVMHQNLVVKIEINGPSSRQRHFESLNLHVDVADDDDLASAYRDFAQLVKGLMGTEIGKHQILALTPFAQPLGQTLRTLEQVVDSLSFEVIDAVPKHAGDLTKIKDELDKIVSAAIEKYSS